MSPDRGRSGRDAQLSSQDAFQELYFRVSERLLVFLTRRTADPQIAADLWGESWARAYASTARFRGSTEAEQDAWVFGIARKVLAGYYKRGRAEQRAMQRLGLERPILDDQDLARLERLAGLEELRAAMSSALQALPANQRQALQLRVVEQRSYQDLAATVGVSEQTARARVSRALRALAGHLQAVDQSAASLSEPEDAR